MKRLLLCLMAMFVIVACTDSGGIDSGGENDGITENTGNGESGNNDSAKPQLGIDDDKLEFPAAGKSIELAFKPNVAWSVEVAKGADWCSVTPMSGDAGSAKVTVTALANESGEYRYADLIFKAEGLQQHVQAVQVQNDAIVVADYEYDVPSYGGEFTFDIQANVSFEVTVSKEAEEWISYAGTRALDTHTLSFYFRPWSSDKAREGSVTITGGTAEPQTITFRQGPPEMIDYSDMPNNEIWYVSNMSMIMNVNPKARFNTSIISHTYDQGKGVIRFAHDLTSIECDQVSGVTLFDLPQALVEICLPQSLTSIAGTPFRMSQNLRALYGKFATEDNRALIYNGALVAFAPAGVEEYTIPDGVTAIGKRVFMYNEELRKVVIPEGVEKIGEAAFMASSLGTSKLEYVSLPSSLDSLGEFAFAHCGKIKKFEGSNNFIRDGGRILVIDNYNRQGISYLVNYAAGSAETSYSIPEGVEGIESYSFAFADKLTSITFPASVSKIASGSVFIGADNIEKVYGPNATADNKSLVVNGELLYVAPKNLVNYTTPDGVIKLGYGVFAGKPELESVVMSDEVLAVGSAISCRPYDIPLGYIFHDCPRLKSVTVSANMRILGVDPFGYNIDTVPDDLRSVYIRAIEPPMIGHNEASVIPTLFKNLVIYVPQESVQKYKSSEYWAPYKDYIQGCAYTDLPENRVYVSSDFSADGQVHTLQSATEGDGIDIVLMGDGFSDRQIADGTYAEVMNVAKNNFFAVEPYKSFKKLFNVYYVDVVSSTEGYQYADTALDGYFGEGTLVGGNDQIVFGYAAKAVGAANLNKSLIVVMMNSTAYAGTCYMYAPNEGDWGDGVSISYFPMGDNVDTFAQLLHHEAGGHGFPKLADEYAYEEKGAVPASEIAAAQSLEYYGWYKNVDFTSDPTAVKWSHFLSDARYASDGLGVYQGAYTYWSGAYRPTENSIMRYNVGGFNAPSREAIYYRIHKLAYGSSWQYDYEEFVEWDAKNRVTSSAAYGIPYRLNVPENFKPLHPPVVVNKSWREVMNK